MARLLQPKSIYKALNPIAVKTKLSLPIHDLVFSYENPSFFRSIEITGGTSDSLIEAGTDLELVCDHSEDWKFCSWKKEDDTVSCETYVNVLDEETACNTPADRAKIVGTIDSCKVISNLQDILIADDNLDNVSVDNRECDRGRCWHVHLHAGQYVWAGD